MKDNPGTVRISRRSLAVSLKNIGKNGHAFVTKEGGLFSFCVEAIFEISFDPTPIFYAATVEEGVLKILPAVEAELLTKGKDVNIIVEIID